MSQAETLYTLLMTMNYSANLLEPTGLVGQSIIEGLMGTLSNLTWHYTFRGHAGYTDLSMFAASFTVISAKGLSNMIQLVFQGVSQAQYWIFWVMLIVMFATALLQVK